MEKQLAALRQSPNGVRFSDLRKICNFYFGKPRQRGTSHLVYKTPWEADPRINIQNDKGKAKAYQVKQVLKAIELLQANHEQKK